MVITLAWLSIISTYWGWWRIGRPVSMSPLEIAKAFDAPLMQESSQNGTVDDHLRAVGSMRLRYGFHDSGALVSKTIHLANTVLQHRENVDDEARLSTDVSSAEQRQSDDIELQSLHSALEGTPETHSDTDNVDTESRRLSNGSEAEVLPTDDGNQEAGSHVRCVPAQPSIRVLRFEEE